MSLILLIYVLLFFLLLSSPFIIFVAQIIEKNRLNEDLTNYPPPIMHKKAIERRKNEDA